MAATHMGGCGFCTGRVATRTLGNLVIGAVVLHLVLGPEKADDFHGFDEAGNALGAVDTEGGVLLVPVTDPDLPGRSGRRTWRREWRRSRRRPQGLEEG